MSDPQPFRRRRRPVSQASEDRERYKTLLYICLLLGCLAGAVALIIYMRHLAQIP